MSEIKEDNVEEKEKSEEEEKLEILEKLHMLELEGERLSRNFTRNDSLSELKFWHQHAIRRQRKQKEQDQYQQIATTFVSAAAAFGMAFGTVLLDEASKRKKEGEKSIVCVLCKAKNTIPLSNSPAFHCENDCAICMDAKACIFQPQCGHIVLCAKCFRM